MRKTYLAAVCAATLIPGVTFGAENFPLGYTSIGVEGSYVDAGNSRNKSAVQDNLRRV